MNNICNIKESMKNNRKELHVLAEIGNQEFKTSNYIKNYLKNIGVEFEEYLDTAVVGIIKGKNPSKTIAFRSDMDALTMGEYELLLFFIKNKGQVLSRDRIITSLWGYDYISIIIISPK